jgi:hypothetical protein
MRTRLKNTTMIMIIKFLTMSTTMYNHWFLSSSCYAEVLHPNPIIIICKVTTARKMKTINKYKCDKAR